MTQVKLTTQTCDILRNYSLINSSILIRKGSIIKTISVGENIVSEYKCEEVWPQTFGIYDLPQFLMAVSLFQDPILEFNNNSYLTIRGNGGNTCKYFFSSPDITLKAAPERDVQFPGADIEFNVATNTLTKIQRAANKLNTPLEISPLIVRIFKDGQKKYGSRAWSSMIVKRMEELNNTDFRAKGFPAELVDSEPEVKGYEI